MRILRFSSYLPEESPIVRWAPIQREGRVCLYNLPNLAPFCREGLLCPALHSVLSKCVNCPVLEWGRALACMQPIRLSSHVMGNGGVGKAAAFLPIGQIWIVSYTTSTFQIGIQCNSFFYTRKGCAGKSISFFLQKNAETSNYPPIPSCNSKLLLIVEDLLAFVTTNLIVIKAFLQW